MTSDELVDRLATNIAALTGAIATLAEAYNGAYGGKPIYAGDTAQNTDSKPPASPAPRGRGRPPKGEASGAVAPPASTAPVATAPVTPASDDPFAPVAPAVKEEDVRTALVALKTATTQENALKVLKEAGGVSNLTELKADKYGAVVEAAKKALPAPKAPVDDDPFASAEVKQEAAPSVEDLKRLIIETQKRTSAELVQKIVMDHGGKAPNPKGGGEGPNFAALPVTKYLEVATELKALPTTK